MGEKEVKYISLMPLLPTRVFDIIEPSELAFKVHNSSCHSAT